MNFILFNFRVKITKDIVENIDIKNMWAATVFISINIQSHPQVFDRSNNLNLL